MGREKTATMQKVAAVTGLSVSTVSRVLSSSDFAREDTRRRVIKAANTLGYTRLRRREVGHPMHFLDTDRARKGDMDTIVLMSSSEANLSKLESPDWIYRDVVPTLQRIAREKGFHLVLTSYGQEDEWKPAAMTAKHIGGVLWMAHDREDLLARISETVPVVVLNDSAIWPPQTSVMCNDRMVMLKAVEHLAELGHRRISYFNVDESPNKPSTHCRERLDAYHEALRYFGLDTDPDLCILDRFGVGEHPQAVARAMDRIGAMTSPPTALVAPLTYSLQFLKETRSRSIAVPDKLSIVAIDNAPAAEWVDPALTVVDCVFGRCTEVAIELLLEEKKTARKYAQTMLIEPELIVRKSTTRPHF